MKQDRINPQPREKWNHVDGGTIYVVDRKPNRVRIQRRPFGDSLAERFMIGLGVFEKIQAGRRDGPTRSERIAQAGRNLIEQARLWFHTGTGKDSTSTAALALAVQAYEETLEAL